MYETGVQEKLPNPSKFTPFYQTLMQPERCYNRKEQIELRCFLLILYCEVIDLPIYLVKMLM